MTAALLRNDFPLISPPPDFTRMISALKYRANTGKLLERGVCMWQFWGGFILLTYTGINIFTGIRLLGLFRYFFPSIKSVVFWPLYILVCYSYIFSFFLRFGWMQPLRHAAVYTLPALVYFFFSLLLLEGTRLVLRFTNPTLLSPLFTAAGTGIALGLALLVMVYGSFHARDIKTAYYSITINKDISGHLGQAEGLRIALISDLHMGATVERKWTARMVDAVNKTNPDMVCITGDIFDNDPENLRDPEGIAAELRRLNAPLGVYACPGNHDVDRVSLSSLREGTTQNHIKDFLKKANIVFLQDEVELAAGCLYLAGRKDSRPIGISEERKSAAELSAGLDKSKPLIILDHQPVDFPNEDKAGADLVLSGHTHKGQFFPGNIATAGIYRSSGAIHYGHWQGNTAQIIVSSGVGVWGPPIRIATDSEVAVVDIKFSN